PRAAALAELVHCRYRLPPHSSSIRQHSELPPGGVPRPISALVFERNPREAARGGQRVKMHTVGQECAANHIGGGIPVHTLDESIKLLARAQKPGSPMTWLRYRIP